MFVDYGYSPVDKFYNSKGNDKASTISYGPGVTGPLAQLVANGTITQQQADEDVSGNATVGLGSGVFRGARKAAG